MVDGCGEQCAARCVVEIIDATAIGGGVGRGGVRIVFEQTIGLLEHNRARRRDPTSKQKIIINRRGGLRCAQDVGTSRYGSLTPSYRGPLSDSRNFERTRST
jgi:hypothetical protein